MYYIGNVVKSVTGLYNQINSATLTGAIDIVVVQLEDGSYVGSPFHVRFGKLGVLSSREKVVEIAVNDEEVDIQMKLGRAGEAFFVEKVLSEENIPYNLATSPIPSSNFIHQSKFHFKKSEENLDELCEEDEEDVVPTLTVGRTYSAPILIGSKEQDSPLVTGMKKQWSYQEKKNHLGIPKNKTNNKILKEVQMEYPLSDMDSPISGSPSDNPLNENLRHVYSDTEIETVVSKVSSASRHDMTWEWGRLPEETPAKQQQKSPRESKHSESNKKTHKKHKKQVKEKTQQPSEGLLLDQVLEMDDREVADLYLNRANSMEDLDVSFGKESTPAMVSKESPPKFSYNVSPIKNDIIDDINKDDVNKDDTLPLTDIEEPKEVVMSLCGNLMSRRVEPERFTEFIVLYEDFGQNPGVLNDPKLVIKINDSYYNWAVAGPYLMSYIVFERTLQPDSLKTLKQRFMPKKRRGWFSWRTAQDQESSEDESNTDLRMAQQDSLEKLAEADNEMDADSENGGNQGDSNIVSDDDTLEYRKSLRLTSDEWKKLNLKLGKNKVTFTVTTRYQGTASCHARIFLWSYIDKIVISDIDGTITKSDVLGQILPVMGRDWSQTGVTGLFSKIKRNGYNFIYLSARAISQAQITRDFLHSVKQGELTLPDGPVLLTPTSLLSAFKKEVIERKPEEFKISCMKDIQRLYESTSNPFYAGFGNRINDVYAYRAVGIPISRIFTINYKGEIKHEKSQAFSTSYSELIEMVDQMFPPLSSSKAIDPAQSEYTAFSYWRTPVSDFPELTDFEFP